MRCAITPITSWARNEPTRSWRFKMVLSDSAEVMETVAKKRFLRKSPFLEFCDAEGLPVITGYGVEDLRTVPLSHWQRLGGPAAYCHLWISEFPARKGESGTFNFYSEVCS